VTGSWVLTPHL